MTRCNKIANDVVFESRWLLYPIALGLIAAALLYTVGFLIEVKHLFYHWIELEPEMVMVAILGLIDTAMVANLLIMITQGSYQIFIRKFDIEHNEQPQWLDHVDSGILKVKISMSVAGITLIRLLKDFINIENVAWEVIMHRMMIHLLCLGSAIAMAIVWRLTHGSSNGNSDVVSHGASNGMHETASPHA